MKFCVCVSECVFLSECVTLCSGVFMSVRESACVCVCVLTWAAGQCVVSRRQQRELYDAEVLSLVPCAQEKSQTTALQHSQLGNCLQQNPPKLAFINFKQPGSQNLFLSWVLSSETQGLHGGFVEPYAICTQMAWK